MLPYSQLNEHQSDRFLSLVWDLVDPSCDYFLYEDLPSGKVYLSVLPDSPIISIVYLFQSVNDVQKFIEKESSDFKKLTGVDKTTRVSYAYNNKTEALPL